MAVKDCKTCIFFAVRKCRKHPKPTVLLGWLSDYPEAEEALMNIEIFCKQCAKGYGWHSSRIQHGGLWWSEVIAHARNTPTQIRMEDTYGE